MTLHSTLSSKPLQARILRSFLLPVQGCTGHHSHSQSSLCGERHMIIPATCRMNATLVNFALKATAAHATAAPRTAVPTAAAPVALRGLAKQAVHLQLSPAASSVPASVLIRASRSSRQTLPQRFRSLRAMATTSSALPVGEFPTPVVSAEWLQQNLDKVQVVDASWYMPNVARDAKAEFGASRIPGAVFLDLDGVCLAESPLPHMLPPATAFAAAMDALGVTQTTPVVVYDGSGLFSAARAWWMFKVFGHAQVATLEGGLPAWVAAGAPVDTGAPAIPAQAGTEACQGAQKAGAASQPSYKATLDLAQVKDVNQMIANCASGERQVVDARSAGRFDGTAPEPRAGLRGGHMPNSCNVAFNEVLTGSGALKPDKELSGIFAGAGINLSGKPITATCGTGVTACVLALALEKLGVPSVAVYDGSWTEWGGREDTPIA